MALGSGWFLRLSDGEVIDVWDHVVTVVEDPERFGLTRAEVKRLDPLNRDDRIKLLLKTLNNGFARIRAHREKVTVEFDDKDRLNAIHRIVSFLRDKSFGPFSQVEIHDVCRGRAFKAPLWILTLTSNSIEKALSTPVDETGEAQG